MSNTNTQNTRVELPHEELTGKVIDAVAYSYRGHVGGRDMYGIIITVQMNEADPMDPFNAKIVRVNWPMNNTPASIAYFRQLVGDMYGSVFAPRDRVLVLQDYVDKGIVAYVRMKDTTKYGTEYYVNEQYKLHFTEEPIYMETEPDVKEKSEVSGKASGNCAPMNRKAIRR